MQKRKITAISILQMVCLLCMGAVAYAILTNGQTVIHSDIATATLLARCQWATKSLFPKSWGYVNGEIWVLGMNVFTFPFTFLLHNQPLARMMGSLCVVLLGSLSIILLDKKMFFDAKSWAISLPVILVCMAGAADGNLYQASYFLTTVYYLLIYYFFRLFSQGFQWKGYIICFALQFLSYLGSSRGYFEWFLPLLGAVFLSAYRNDSLTQPKGDAKTYYFRRALSIAVILGIPAVLGKLGYEYLSRRCSISTLDTYFASSLQEVGSNLMATVLNLYSLFGYGFAPMVSLQGVFNVFSIFMCTMMIFVIPILQFVHLKEETEEVRFFAYYTYLHMIEFLMLPVLFGYLSERYLMTSEYLLIILSSRYIVKHLIEPLTAKRLFWTLGIIAAFAVGVTMLVQSTSGWKGRLKAQRSLSEEIIARGYGDYKGYADYWEAYKNEIYSNERITFAAVLGEVQLGDINHYGSLVDTQRELPSDGGSFIMIPASQEVNMDNYRLLFDEPEDVFETNGQYIIVYDYDIGENNFFGNLVK